MNLGKIIKGIGIGAGSLASLFIVILLCLEFFISDSYIANTVQKASSRWLSASLKVEKIHLSAFAHFPHIGIELEKGEVVTQTDISPSRADTLLAFDNFTLLFSPLKLLMGQVDIQGIELSAPKVYGYISKTGDPNWNIVKEDQDAAIDTTSTEEVAFNINVRNISIKDRGYFVFDNRQEQLRASLFLNSFELQGRFTNDLEKIRIRKGNFSRVNLAVAQQGINKYLSQLVAENADIPDSLAAKNLSILSKANRASLRFSIDTLNLESINRGKYGIEARTRTNIRLAKNAITENLPLDIKGNVSLGRNKKGISVEDMRISLAGIPLNINGEVEYGNGKLHTDNLVARIEEFPLEEFIKYIPKAIVPQKEKVNTNARLSVDANVYGTYNAITGELPYADITVNIPNSHIGFQGRKEKIKDLHLNATYHFRNNNADSNMVRIEKFGIDGDGILLGGKGSVADIMGDPFIDIQMNGYLNLDSAIQMLPAGSDIFAQGKVDASMIIKSRLSNLTPYNLANTNLKGSLTANNVNIGIPSQKIYCSIYGGSIDAGSTKNTRDTSIKMGTKMIGVRIDIDSTYIRYTDSLLIKGRDIRFFGRNEASLFDTTSKAVKPFKGTLAAKSFVMYGPDSTSIRIASTKNTFSILPYKGDINVPAIHLASSNRMIMLRQDVNFISVSNGEFDLQANLNDAQTKIRELRMARLTDSLQVVYPQISRDSLLGHWMMERRKLSGRNNLMGRNNIPDDFAQEDYNFRLADKGILYILNRWEAQGKLSAGRIRVATPIFPLRTRIEEPEMKFDLNTVKIEKANIHTGHSSFKVMGDLKGIKGALSRGSRLKASLNIDADTLNFNELAQAAAAGEEFMSKGAAYKDSLMMAESEESLEEMVAIEGADTSGKMALIIIPRNIEAQLNMNVKYGIYSSIVLHKASGKVNSKDRCLQIMDFNATTSAGAMDLNAFYRTRSKEDLSVGFDLQFTDMDMGEFIRLYPGMDTLLPMLKSFEGIINCQMTATSQIDTNMNVILPTIEGVARIKGDSLVLLDGETFAEIAKMLKFKNRERNLVDSIAVEVAIKDNQVEVFPFIMKMDRYTAAISGKQDLDMNFDYHISVLKSPVPMKMGINISGNMDDFKFRIGKAKYKDTNLPVYSKMIDSTRVNLLEQIKDIYQNKN